MTTPRPDLPEQPLTAADFAYWEAQLPDPEPRRRELLIDPHSLTLNTREHPFGASVGELGRHRNAVSGMGTPVVHPHNPHALADPAACWEDADGSPEVGCLVKQLLEGLPVLDRVVVRLRWGIGGEPLTQSDVAQRLGVDRKTLRGIERRALACLQHSAGQPADGQLDDEAATLHPSQPTATPLRLRPETSLQHSDDGPSALAA